MDGQLLIGRYGALIVLQCVELPDGRDGIDIFACAERSCSLPYVMLADALELARRAQRRERAQRLVRQVGAVRERHVAQRGRADAPCGEEGGEERGDDDRLAEDEERSQLVQ